MLPVISVLMPAFNAEATIAATLRSIQRQTETRWECVVVDDGSSDGTLAQVRQVAREDPRCVVIATPHRGLVAALNTGLRHCRGEFVARMDADDLMHHDRLNAQTRMLVADPTLAAVGCHVRIFPRCNVGLGLRAYEDWLNSIDSADHVRRDAYIECPIAHPTLVMRRAVAHAFRYRDCGWPEDYDLILRLLTSGHRVGVVPRRLLSWRQSRKRLSLTDARYRIERFTLCKAAFLSSHFLSATETYALWGYGATGRALRRALLTHGKRPSHVIEVHPGRLGQTIHGAPVITPDELPQTAPCPVIVSVAGETARRQIRDRMRQFGFSEHRNFVCAA